MNARFSNQVNNWGTDDAALLTLLKQHKQAGDAGKDHDADQKIREYFTKDIVVVLGWDTNRTDVDLHVIEPDGEECFYSKKSTKHGGTLDHDVTTGLGPETYSVRRAKPGKYRIDVEYFSGGPRTVATVQIYRHRNAPTESVTSHTVELRQVKDRVTVQTLDMDEGTK